jgi:hypothetical protein
MGRNDWVEQKIKEIEERKTGSWVSTEFLRIAIPELLGEKYELWLPREDKYAPRGISYEGRAILKTKVNHIVWSAAQEMARRHLPPPPESLDSTWRGVPNYGSAAVTSLPLKSVGVVPPPPPLDEEKEAGKEFEAPPKRSPVEVWIDYNEVTDVVPTSTLSRAVSDLMVGCSLLVSKDKAVKYVVRDIDRAIVFKSQTNKELLGMVLDHVTSPTPVLDVEPTSVNPIEHIKREKLACQERVNATIDELRRQVGGKVEVEVRDGRIVLHVNIRV